MISGGGICGGESEPQKVAGRERGKAVLSVKMAAKKAGVSAACVYSWVESGMLSHYRLGRRPGSRGCIRIAEADLDAFLASMRKEGGQASMPAKKVIPTVRLKHLQL
jgi:excisionase family DNA binding protein